MKDLDKFSALTSFLGGLIAVLILWNLRHVINYILNNLWLTLTLILLMPLSLPYIFCSCMCERKYIYHSFGGLGALTGASIGWVPSILWIMVSPSSIQLSYFWHLMYIPILAFLFSRYYCMVYKEKDDAPIFKRFLIIFGCVITYIFLMFFWAFILMFFFGIPSSEFPFFWFLFTALFWAVVLIIAENRGTKSIPHYLNNLGVAFIVFLPLWMMMLYRDTILLTLPLLILPLPPIFSLLYTIKKNEKTYLYDAISVFCVAIICIILVAATLPLVTTGY